MKRTLLFLSGLALIVSCSAPKYTYNFDHYNYNGGKKKAPANETVVLNEGPQSIQPEMLTASAAIETAPIAPLAETKTTPVKKTYAQMDKTERKQLRSYLKAEVKHSVNAKKATAEASAAKGMDGDLKLAVIFGAVGIVGLIIGGDVFYIIGGIALLIGVVFFVKWVIRQ